MSLTTPGLIDVLTHGAPSENLLVHGDNLRALEALMPSLEGRVRCVYIDPPFNTGQSMDHYEDGLEREAWLRFMEARVALLHRTLRPDGAFFAHIDQGELGVLLVLLDRIFGRDNRISVITFVQSAISGPKSHNPGLVSTTNFLLYYAKDRACWRPNRLYRQTPRDKAYNRFLLHHDDPPSRWRLMPLGEAFARSQGQPGPRAHRQALGGAYEAGLDRFVLEHAGQVVQLARVLPKDVNVAARAALLRSTEQRDVVQHAPRADRDDYHFLNGRQLIFYATRLRDVDGRRVPALPLSDLWDDIPSNGIHGEGGVRFRKGKKPEALLKRVLELESAPGDLVLDAFAGSGTTGAVAHKLGRRWVMMEQGEQCVTHVLPRLRAVVDGQDAGGVSGVVGWTGGGGFRVARV